MQAERLRDGKNLLLALKAVAGAPGANLVLPIGNPALGFLRPLAARPEWIRPEDISKISQWRNRFVKNFLTEFHAHDARTSTWLTSYVALSESKIIFMVDLPNGETIGQIGLDFIDWNVGYGEADAIIRGGEAPKGLMKVGLQTVLSWAKAQLGLDRLGVRVRSDNTALIFYEKVGFVETKRVPLRRVDEPDMVRWMEDEDCKDSSASLVYMEYRPVK